MNNDEPTDSYAETEVRSMRILPVAGVDILPGGMYIGDSVARVQIVDRLAYECLIVPVNRTALNALIGQATHCLEMSDEARRIVGEGE